jgi:carboxymethylenebutenolidase
MSDFIEVQLDEPRGRKAEMLVPSGDDLPGVVVVHDIYGLTDDTRRHCRNFADAGYAAIAPDLYRGGSPVCVVSTLRSMLRQEGEALEGIEAARRALAERPEVDPDRIGITGFCMGGGFAILAAADGRYAVAGPFYGEVPQSAERLRGICPTIAQAGGKDHHFASAARRLSAHLHELGVEHEVIIYEDVGHSFMNDHEGPLVALGRYTPLHAAYDAHTESKAWPALLDFFERHT